MHRKLAGREPGRSGDEERVPDVTTKEEERHRRVVTSWGCETVPGEETGVSGPGVDQEYRNDSRCIVAEEVGSARGLKLKV